MVVQAQTRKDMLKYALTKGFVPMVEDGLEKVVEGIIDLKELTRVVDLTERM